MLCGHVVIQLQAPLERLTTQVAGMLTCFTDVHLLVANQALLPRKLSVTTFALMNIVTKTFHLLGLHNLGRTW